MELMNNSQGLSILAMEGTGYGVQEYTDGSNFDDPITVNLWASARASLNALVTYLEADTGESLEDY